MDNEDILKIAEGMEIYARMDCDDVIVYKYNADTDRYRYQAPFDPLNNWNDCGLVLEALVNKHLLIVGLQSSNNYFSVFDAVGDYELSNGSDQDFYSEDKDLKEAICKAYLVLIK